MTVIIIIDELTELYINIAKEKLINDIYYTNFNQQKPLSISMATATVSLTFSVAWPHPWGTNSVSPGFCVHWMDWRDHIGQKKIHKKVTENDSNIQDI